VSMEIPYTVELRPDTGLTNGKLGIWLFLASEVMLFGALFASYVMLRVGAHEWPAGAHYLNIPLATLNTVILISSSVTMVLAWASLAKRDFGRFRLFLGITILCGLGFLVVKYFEYTTKFHHGYFPSTNTFLAIYFTLTGLHGLHVIGGFILGFDGEDHTVFETQRAFIEASGIGVSIVGLLGAIPNTQLSRRLEKEGRLLPNVQQFTINSFDGLNFIPKGTITKREYLERYASLVRAIYLPDEAFARSVRGLLAMRRPRRRRPWAFYRTYVPAMFRLLYHLGIRSRSFRRPFWRSLIAVAVKNPNAIDAFFFDALFLYHLYPFAEHVVRALARYVVSPDVGDILDEAIPPTAPSPHPDAPLHVHMA